MEVIAVLLDFYDSRLQVLNAKGVKVLFDMKYLEKLIKNAMQKQEEFVEGNR